MGLFRKSEINFKIKSGYSWDDKREFFRDFHESIKGKRDVWAWIYGIVVPLLLIAHMVLEYKQLKEKSLPHSVMEAYITYDGICITVVMIISLSFFLGKRWARKAVFAIPFVAAIAFNVIMKGILTTDAITEATTKIIGSSLFGLLIYAGVISSSIQNKAFFGIHVYDYEIEKYWGAVSNKYAQYAALSGLFLPFVAIVLIMALDFVVKSSIVHTIVSKGAIIFAVALPIWLGIKGLKAVTVNTIPPIMGRGYAIFGIVTAVLWGVFLFRRLLAIFMQNLL